MLKRELLVILALLIAPTAWSGELSEGPLPFGFTFEQLKSLIEERRLQSIDELVPLLPKKLRSNVSLVYRSESAQRDAVDPVHPRVILYRGDVATQRLLFLAYVGEESRPEAQDLEVIEFDPESSRFEPRLIRFPFRGARERAELEATQGSQLRLQAAFDLHPTSCFKCHGQDPHPIWDPYKIWHGVYGVFDDIIEPASRVGSWYSEFVSGPGRSFDRYGFLDLKRHLFRTGAYVQASHADSATYEHRPNVEINNLLSVPMAKRALRIAKSSELYGDQKYRVLSELVDCDKRLLERQKKLKSSPPYMAGFSLLEAIRKEALAEAFTVKFRLGREGVRYLDLDARVPYNFIADLPTPLHDLLGIDLRVLGSALGDRWPIHEDGRGSFVGFIAIELLHELEREDPELAKVARIRQRYGYPAGYEFYGFDQITDTEALCSLLKKRQSQVGGWSGTIEATAGRGLPTASNPAARHCSECHDGKNLPGPLDDPSELPRVFSEHPGLRAEVLKRLRASGLDSMPQGRKLQETEILELEEYFKEQR